MAACQIPPGGARAEGPVDGGSAASERPPCEPELAGQEHSETAVAHLPAERGAVALAAQPEEDLARPLEGDEEEAGPAGPELVKALASVLTHLASMARRPQRVTRFHAIRAPQLSIYDYLLRIATYFQCSNECFVLGLVYLDRIVKLHPEFTICSLSIHRLLVTGVMLAAKFFDDVYYSNAYYAKVGGVRMQELNVLEAQFLNLLGWRLHVLPQEYEQYRRHVLRAVGGGPEENNRPVLEAEETPR